MINWELVKFNDFYILIWEQNFRPFFQKRHLKNGVCHVCHKLNTKIFNFHKKSFRAVTSLKKFIQTNSINNIIFVFDLLNLNQQLHTEVNMARNGYQCWMSKTQAHLCAAEHKVDTVVPKLFTHIPSFAHESLPTSWNHDHTIETQEQKWTL